MRDATVIYNCRMNYIESSMCSLWDSEESSLDRCPPSLRTQLRKKWWNGKYKGECFCCGKIKELDDIQVGRIKAGFEGGKYTLSNCRLVCRSCNGNMSTRNMKTYMKEIFPERYTKYFGKDTETSKVKTALKSFSLAKLKYLAKENRINVKGRTEEDFLVVRQVAPSKEQFVKALSKLTQEKIDSDLKKMPKPEKKKKRKKRTSDYW